MNARFSLGISTASLFLRHNTEDALALLPSFGAEAVEVFMATFREYKPPFDSIFAQKAKESGANVHSVHTLNQHFEPELFNNNLRTREDAEEWLYFVLNNAKAMGAKYYTFHGIPKLKSKAYHVDFATLGPKVKSINDICQMYGVRLCYENVHWSLYDKPGFFRQLAPYDPQLRATLDIKQAMQANADYRDFLQDMGDRLATVHVCDYDREGRLCLPAKGIFDFKELFCRLADQGFEGAVLIEAYEKDYQQECELKDSLDYLKSIRQTI